MSLQLDAFIPHRRGTSVAMYSCFYFQAAIHKLYDTYTLSAGCAGGSAQTAKRLMSTCSLFYLHVGVLNAKNSRVTQAFGGNHVDPKLALAVGHLLPGFRLIHT